MTRLLMVAAALVAVLAAGVVSGAGAEWHVYPGAGTPIQDAIDDAEPGDTIYVHAGGYVENVEVGKRITLIGDGADVVTVEARAPMFGFNVTASWVNVSGFAVASTTFSRGIYLFYTNHCNISDNMVSNNGYGIVLVCSNNNTLTDNNASTWLVTSSNNTLTNNIVPNGYHGIYFTYSNNNTLVNNTALNNHYGIILCNSSGNTLTSNKMSGNKYNFGIYGGNLSEYIQNIDPSNKVDGKPIYYWVDQQDKQVPCDAGFVGVVNSTNITVRGIAPTNNWQGILFAYTRNSKIKNVDASNNYYGIWMRYSDDNTLVNNNASNNGDGIRLQSSGNNTLTSNNCSNNGGGIHLCDSSNHNTLTNNTASNNYHGIYISSSSHNTIYHNLADNTLYNAYDTDTNQWDSGAAGNYYSDYNGADNNTDGIGDTPYPIPGGTSTDRFPLMQPWTGDTPQKGDLNGDKRITIADAAIALRLAATGAHNSAADVSSDGSVTSLDVLMILKAAAGNIEL